MSPDPKWPEPVRWQFQHRFGAFCASIRAWFDHYLKGAPAEPWITEGVTALARDGR